MVARVVGAEKRRRDPGLLPALVAGVCAAVVEAASRGHSLQVRRRSGYGCQLLSFHAVLGNDDRAHERVGVGVYRVEYDFFARALFDQLARVHDDDVVRDVPEQRQFVRYEDHGLDVAFIEHFAEHLVYQVTMMAKEEGYTPMLYTNADYTASNSCYEKIGYVLQGKLCTIG